MTSEGWQWQTGDQGWVMTAAFVDVTAVNIATVHCRWSFYLHNFVLVQKKGWENSLVLLHIIMSRCFKFKLVAMQKIICILDKNGTKTKRKCCWFCFFRPVPAVPHTGRVWRQVTGKTLSTIIMMTLLMMMMTMMMRIMLCMMILTTIISMVISRNISEILITFLNLSKLLRIICKP